MKAFRIALWSLIAVFAAFLIWRTTGDLLNPQERQRAVARVADIGGPFEATLSTPADPKGKPVTQADINGRPHAMFFGFTNCPDVCPTTLYEASQWLAALGEEADKLDVYFVSVDPERDTAETMAAYLTPFDKRIAAISGTPEQMEAMRKKWRVVAKKVPLEGGDYNVDHTATVYLMDAKGEFFGTIGHQENPETAVAKLKRLVRDGA